MQSRREWPGAELCERLEVEPRTLRRDITRLRELGYAIEASSGPGGGYRFGPGASMPLLLLDDDEALAVTVALRVVVTGVARLEQTAMRVLMKIEQLLPRRLRRRLSALQAATVSLERGGELVDAAWLTRLASACRDHVEASFHYQDLRGRASLRVVEPAGLAHTGRRWYLVAWDRGREDWRTFRVDRVRSRPALGQRFEPRAPPGGLASYVSENISTAPYPAQLRVELAGAAARVAERIPPWVGVVEPIDEARCSLSIGAPTPEALISLLVLADVDFELVEPRSLAPTLRRVGERLLAAARAATRDDAGPRRA
ncbi:MAG: WYL domain-containing protein [Nannocystaceae bacterium]